MKVGFTGTQKGMTIKQKRNFFRILKTIHFTEFHHGDCKGADKEAHDIVALFFKDVTIIIHPPDNDLKRAHCVGDVWCLPKPYLERNHDIVNECNILIAIPKNNNEVLRSGTWATIRYARKKYKEIIIVNV